jgi:hypothetical protein
VIGARRGRDGTLRPDPNGNFQFPLSGAYRRSTLQLGSTDLSLQFSFGAVPLGLFDVRGQMGPGLAMRPGAGIYSETICADVPNYSLQLRIAGVCNAQDTLAASGTLLTGAYGSHAANRRPAAYGWRRCNSPGPARMRRAQWWRRWAWPEGSATRRASTSVRSC